MKAMWLGCAAAVVLLLPAAQAQDVPKLRDFLMSCSRDSGPCKVKLKDYVTAANAQKIICLPKDVSINEAAGDVLRWLRSDVAEPMKESPFDDALFEAATKLYPCAANPVPPPPPAAEPPATPPQQ